MSEGVVISAAVRSPHGEMNGQLSALSAPTLGAQTVAACLKQLPATSRHVDSVFMGNVLSAGLGQAPARQVALGAGLSEATPCLTLNKMCGSGMQSIICAHDSILAGSQRLAVAGGMENMSLAPHLLPRARQGYRLGSRTVLDHMMHDGLTDAYEQRHPMGVIAEHCALAHAISREAQDRFAERSLQAADQAQRQGLFDAERCVITVSDQHQVSTDETIQPELAHKIPRLKPVFSKDGTITAANASSIADGASSLVLCDAQQAYRDDLPILARIVAHHTHAALPQLFPTAPIAAITGVLDKAQWPIQSVDLFEINEAFAVVPLLAQQALEIPLDKLNIHGGACALGHPIGASGARIVVTLLHALKQHQLKRGVAAICIGGGEATAIAVELP